MPPFKLPRPALVRTHGEGLRESSSRLVSSVALCVLPDHLGNEQAALRLAEGNSSCRRRTWSQSSSGVGCFREGRRVWRGTSVVGIAYLFRRWHLTLAATALGEKGAGKCQDSCHKLAGTVTHTNGCFLLTPDFTGCGTEPTNLCNPHSSHGSWRKRQAPRVHLYRGDEALSATVGRWSPAQWRLGFG